MWTRYIARRSLPVSHQSASRTTRRGTNGIFTSLIPMGTSSASPVRCADNLQRFFLRQALAHQHNQRGGFALSFASQNRYDFLVLHEQRNEVLLLGIAVDNDFVPLLRVA